MRNWYKKYFGVQPTGECFRCGKLCVNVFCSEECEQKTFKDHGLDKIEKQRKEVAVRVRRIKRRYLIDRDGEEKLSYQERINRETYSNAMARLDAEAKRLKEMTERSSFPQGKEHSV